MLDGYPDILHTWSVVKFIGRIIAVMTLQASKATNRWLVYSPDSNPPRQLYHKDKAIIQVTLSFESWHFYYIISHMCCFSNTAIKMEEHRESVKGKKIALIIWSFQIRRTLSAACYYIHVLYDCCYYIYVLWQYTCICMLFILAVSRNLVNI